MLARFVNSLPNGIAQQITKLYFQALSSGRGAHSSMMEQKLREVDVVILPALADNYMYLVSHRESGDAAIIDPVDPQSVLKEVAARGLTLRAALTTHHHWDHAGGNERLAADVPGLQVYGGDDRIPALTKLVAHGDRLELGALRVQCLHTPAHTRGHICYVIDDAVFTGDTLFVSGCGKLFEGTPDQLCNAMDTLASLADETRVFCGHEYALANLRFAALVEPDNEHVRNKTAWAKLRRDEGLPTVPSTIGEEKQFNPFMRVRERSLQAYTRLERPADVIAKLRKLKDDFK